MGSWFSFLYAAGDSGGCGWFFGFEWIWLGRHVIVGEALVRISFRGNQVLSLLHSHPS